MSTAAASAGRGVRAAPAFGFAVSAFLIGYGELYPFDYVPPPSAAAAWHAFLAKTTLVTSAGDMLGNVVLALPLGVFGSAMLRRARHRRLALALLFACSMAGMFALQAAQIWFPPRDASLADVFWHGVGMVASLLASASLQRLYAGRRSPLLPGAAVPVALLGAWLLTQLAPFLPSLDWQLVKEQLKPVLESRRVDAAQLVFVAGRAMAACWLLGLVVALTPMRRAAAAALLLAALLAAKLVIAGQGWRVETLAGYALGWLGCCMAWRAGGGRGAAAVAALLLAGYSLSALSPFAWQAAASRTHWLPFEAMLSGAIEVNAWALVESCYVFGTLLWLAKSNGASVVGTAVALALWVGALEWLQRWLPGRTSDATLPLLALAIGCALQLAPVPRRAVAAVRR